MSECASEILYDQRHPSGFGWMRGNNGVSRPHFLRRPDFFINLGDGRVLLTQVGPRHTGR